MPIVPVPKPDGSVRICGVFKVTIILVSQIDKHPFSKPENPLTILAGEQNSQNWQVYQQMLLDPEDRKYTTINTHL